MKIAVFSDLHVEFGQPLDIDCGDADIIILAGDCHKGGGIIRIAAGLRKKYDVPVLTVAGNHEFYGDEHSELLDDMRFDAAISHVDFLENSSVVYKNVRFLGCTLWTNFCLYGVGNKNILQSVAEKSISDFWYIKFDGRRFNPADAASLFDTSYAWLQGELSKPFTGKTVVISHFAPHEAAKHKKYPKDDPISPYFISDCSDLMNAHSINLWIYGHTHSSVDVVLESGTRLVSNQKGYPSEDPEYTQFNRSKICEI